MFLLELDDDDEERLRDLILFFLVVCFLSGSSSLSFLYSCVGFFTYVCVIALDYYYSRWRGRREQLQQQQ